MVSQLTVTFEQAEYSALLEVAVSELRAPQDQVRYMVRRELQNMGLLKNSNTICKEFSQEVHSDA